MFIIVFSVNSEIVVIVVVIINRYIIELMRSEVLSPIVNRTQSLIYSMCSIYMYLIGLNYILITIS